MDIMTIISLIKTCHILARYFVLVLLAILVISFVMLCLRKRKKVTSIFKDKIPSKYCYLLLLVALISCLLKIVPISAAGYDCPMSVFTVDHVRVNGPLTIFQTDRPVTFFIMFVVGESLNIPGRVSVPVSVVIFTMLYVFSVFILTYTLTKSKFLGAIASLFVANSNITMNTAFCWIGQMLAFAFLYLFFSSIIMICKTKNTRQYSFLGILLFILLLFTHVFTAIISAIILAVFCVYLLFRKKTILARKIIGVGIVCFIIIIIYLISYPDSYAVFVNICNEQLGGSSSSWLTKNWTAIYIWTFIFSFIGFWFVSFEDSIRGMFLTSWTVTMLIPMLMFIKNSDRMFILLPIPILVILGLSYVARCCSKNYKRGLFAFVIIFLVFSSCIHYSVGSYKNVRYFEDDTFPWETVFIEIEQLRWIAKNCSLNDRVVLTDIGVRPWNKTEFRIHGVYVGVHMRILAEVGDHVYFGELADLFEEKSDCRDGKAYPSNMVGRYSGLNVDWTLGNKTIFLPSSIYIMDSLEEEIVYEIHTGIYVVKDLTEQEKTDWLRRWYNDT